MKEVSKERLEELWMEHSILTRDEEEDFEVRLMSYREFKAALDELTDDI